MAPEDFRQHLYAAYRTTQQAGALETGHSDRDSWWGKKVLPFISDLDRESWVLELGAGAGQFLGFLRRRGFTNASGVDASTEQVKAAIADGLPVQVGDALEFLDETNRRYGCVVCLDFLEHMTRDELVRLVPLILDRLEPGGRVLIQTANGGGLLPFQVALGDLTHMTIMTEGSLTQLLRWAGFERIRMAETGPAATGPKGVLRLAAWRIIRAVAASVHYIETGKKQSVWTENLLCVAYKPTA